MDNVALKKAMRKEITAARKALPREVVEEKSLAIFERWRKHFPLKSIQWLHLFQSISARNEVETKYFEDYLRK
ncbi:MAG TPA: hypothetical protein ENJ82_17825, partial [Bacteroidetes bacterium]|nr:hypothetical protein [Bacteroidota bacterium]